MEGKPHLGTSLGSKEYSDKCTKEKVAEWSLKLEKLTTIAETEPHAAITHGLASKWTYLSRTTPDISEHLEPLEMTGRLPPSDTERELLALPARLGGIGLHNPSKRSSAEYSASQKITSALKTMILEQSTTYSPEVCENQLKAKGETHKQRRSQQLEAASLLKPTLSSTLQHSMALAQEKGASSWLTALPVSEFGFNLHKCAFRDALCLRYGWLPSSTPTNCKCGKTFSVEHVLSCPKGGFPSLRHNEIRDITANLLSEVCNNVCIEPHLQPISGEHLPGTSQKELA